MALLDYFQTKCPVCKQKLKLKPNMTFTSKPVAAGQCHSCQADLQWVRSNQKTLVMAVFAAIFLPLTIFVFSLIKEGNPMPLYRFVAMILAASITFGFFFGKELAVTQAFKPADK